MRYYKIVLTNPETGNARTFTSLSPEGKNLPGALNVELDVPVVPFATPYGAAFVHVDGVSLADIGQASDFNGSAISVYAGMTKGLPLANPAQAGLIAQGYVFQAYGNWIGTEQSLDLIINPGTGTGADPKNIVFNWKKGTPFADAVTSTLTTAFPGYTVAVSVNPRLVLPADEVGYYATTGQFAAYLKSMTAAILGGGYAGVDVILTEKAFSVYDGSTISAPKAIAFPDMIGQPTWIDPLTVQVKLVMRADLGVGDFIKFPPAQVTNPGTTSPFVNAKSTFQGAFQVGAIRHVGNFRQPDAASWVTVVNAYSIV